MDQRLLDDLVVDCGMPPQSYFWEWNHWARWQFRLIITQIKVPRSSHFLDVGCGAMRLGHLLVPYLDDDRYCGIDALQSYIEFAHKLMKSTGNKKKYHLLCSSTFDFKHFNRKFDVAFAQSVLGHLSLEENRLCFQKLKKVMKPGAKFHATVSLAGNAIPKAKVGFFYNGTYPFRRPLFKDLGFLESLCDELELEFAKVEGDHPGQDLVRVTF